jgi:type VI secretion system protein ImpD
MLNHLTEETYTETLEIFLNTKAWREALPRWCQLSGLDATQEPSHLKRAMSAQIAHLDQIINAQINEILHEPLFQAMEARWRGVHYLIKAAENSSLIKIRLLDVSWTEIHRDTTRFMEFDQSELFAKIYSEEFGSPGGTPFSLLLGDYALDITGPEANFNITALTGIVNVAAASFSPFIAAVKPTAFGVDDFTTPLSFTNIESVFKQASYTAWNEFRKNPDTRFLGLTLPRVIFREPYKNQSLRLGKFLFQETISNNVNDYLWGNGCFAFGIVVIRSFLLTGWPASIRGVKSIEEAGGIVEGLPMITQHQGQLSEKFSTELLIDNQDESVIAELGLIPLCQYGDTGKALFYSNASVFNAKQSSNQHENTNTKLSSLLQYVLSASRFAHYIKIMGRNWIGSLYTANDLQMKLNQWINNFVATNDIEETTRRRYPLQEGKIEVEEMTEKPGAYHCTIYLKPKLQLEKIDTALKLTTELTEIKN